MQGCRSLSPWVSLPKGSLSLFLGISSQLRNFCITKKDITITAEVNRIFIIAALFSFCLVSVISRIFLGSVGLTFNLPVLLFFGLALLK